MWLYVIGLLSFLDGWCDGVSVVQHALHSFGSAGATWLKPVAPLIMRSVVPFVKKRPWRAKSAARPPDRR
jgi:hypothetical protein